MWVNHDDYDADGFCSVTVQCDAPAVAGVVMPDGAHVSEAQDLAMLLAPVSEMLNSEQEVSFPGCRSLKTLKTYLNKVLDGTVDNEKCVFRATLHEFLSDAECPDLAELDAQVGQDLGRDVASHGGR